MKLPDTFEVEAVFVLTQPASEGHAIAVECNDVTIDVMRGLKGGQNARFEVDPSSSVCLLPALKLKAFFLLLCPSSSAT
ncbi:MAG TPA: hypothetical protein VK678_07440 [Bradyrhizobium sp.]|nr:hypothetical protein [Bradyrhizobium sp.]